MVTTATADVSAKARALMALARAAAVWKSAPTDATKAAAVVVELPKPVVEAPQAAERITFDTDCLTPATRGPALRVPDVASKMAVVAAAPRWAPEPVEPELVVIEPLVLEPVVESVAPEPTPAPPPLPPPAPPPPPVVKKTLPPRRPPRPVPPVVPARTQRPRVPSRAELRRMMSDVPGASPANRGRKSFRVL